MSSTSALEKDDTARSNRSAVSRELLFKFLIVGDYGVGKTAIVRRYTEGQFSSNYKITIGADFSIKSLQWDEQTKINLQLWDIAGHERFGYMTRVYYKYAVAAAVVFDVSRIQTFQSVSKWLSDLREKVTLHDGTPVPVVLLANKCDIQGIDIATDTIVRFCSDNKIEAWFVTSAKENINIEEAMTFLVDKVIHFKAQETNNDAIMLQETRPQNNKYKASCCG
ncbi:ras-related protein Rab-32-like [Zootermopsis nevadensis]|uniref:ras-related protein Rab-32-like n=1 Tax=Zootermopsis nevadensis TaxID=136037 RepID=UPI000B8E5EEB|nr:ras-related protein Rab-32-like [Zootermopsis nevadensis]